MFSSASIVLFIYYQVIGTYGNLIIHSYFNTHVQILQRHYFLFQTSVAD